METYPILNDQDDPLITSPPTDGYTLIQSRNLRQNQNFAEKLKYPKTIDPFRTCHQVVLIVSVEVLIVILFGICFTLELFISIKFIEFGICAIVCLQFTLMMFFYAYSLSWCNFLANSGFYCFPKRIIFQRTLVLFVWSLGVFFLSPVLLAIKIVCDQDKLENQDKICIYQLSNINLMRIYVGLETVLVVIFLTWYFGIVLKFKIQRRWPDIWHERLLEESSLVDLCPFIKLSELRIENTDHITSTQHYNSDKRPTDVEIMQTQAYVIGYLRKLNNNLALRINHLSRELKQDLLLKVEANNATPRNDIVDSLSVMSSESSNGHHGAIYNQLSSRLT